MRRAGLLAALGALLLAPAAAWGQASPSPYTSATRYDAGNRVAGTISADPDGVGAGNPFLAVRNSYDLAGRLTRVETGTLSAWQAETVLPANWGAAFTVLRTAETHYDVMNRKTRETLREGAAGTIRAVTQYSYDAEGRLDCTAIRMNPADFAAPPGACTQGTGGADRITRTLYDDADRRIQLREGVGTAVEGTEATWAYDLNDRITAVVDGNGNRAALVYDGHGRQTCWMFPSAARAAAFKDATPASALDTSGAIGGTIGSNGHCATGDFEAYTYDANGNRTNLRKRDTRNIVFAYDALNRVTEKTYPQGGAIAVFYGYDLRGLQLYARHASATGHGIANAYDGFGRLASTSTDMDGTTRTLTYAWDRDGNRTRITHPGPNGPSFDTSYDGLDRLTGLGTSGYPLAQGYYATHGAQTALHRVGIATHQVIATDYASGYDGIQRPSGRVQHHYQGQWVSWSFGRNAAGQLSSVERSNDAFAWTGHYAVQRTYTTNGLNQYSQTGGTTLGYDANGNLTAETPPSPGTSRTYTYDVENRLVSVSNGTALSYDPLGRLYEISLGGNTTRFLYDGDALVAEYDGDGTMTRRYVHWVGADVPIVAFEGSDLSTPRQLFADHQGSIVSAADVDGHTNWINRYDEYGIPAGTNQGRFQYTGQIWLSEIGLYHYKARIYSPTLGRFLQTDPIGYEDQFNLYAYVGNDPVNHADPSGRCFVVLCPAVPAAVETGIGILTACAANPVCRGIAARLIGGAVRSGIPLLTRPVRNEENSDNIGDVKTGEGVGDAVAETAAVPNRPPRAPGAAGGPRAGRGFTPRGRRAIDQRNEERHGGMPTCENCLDEVVPGRRHERGVRPPGNERHRDHRIPRSQGGDGTEENGDVLCRDCNLKKTDRMPE